jgi:anti-sigma factor ChrR (cupin superfamily)
MRINSPESGVDRLMLDRIGDEVARATSIVRYAPGSSFSEHVHAKGEEFLVLEGVFSDKSGNYPTGTYVRNPPGSSHAPHSVDGCRILVKLRQFDADDLTPVVIDSTDQELWLSADESIARLPLHEYGSEYENSVLNDECWLRLPPGASAELVARTMSIIWLKQGHLPGDS